jgi:predicted alpha/beta hydrolase family esterase
MRRVYLAGIGNSGPAHWQALWHAQREDVVWVERSDWDVAGRDTWVEETRAALVRVDGSKILIAHSLGCLLAGEFLTQYGPSGVVGALLVSVPDPAGSAFPAQATGFHSALTLHMPVPSIVVASSDDPYGSIEYVRAAASHWGSRLHEIGARGHINADSQLGTWPHGAGFMDELLQMK